MSFLLSESELESRLKFELDLPSDRLFLCKRCDVNGVTGKDGKDAELSYNADSPIGKPDDSPAVWLARSAADDAGENTDDILSNGYDLNGRLIPTDEGVVGDDGNE